jgi:hypothetical protein
MVPPKCPSLIPRNFKYVTLHDKGDFVDVIKDLEKGRLSWIIWGDKHIVGDVTTGAGGWSHAKKGPQIKECKVL